MTYAQKVRPVGMFHTSVILQCKLCLTNEFKHIQNNKVTGLIKEIVEHCYGMLKERFKSLRCVNHKTLKL